MKEVQKKHFCEGTTVFLFEDFQGFSILVLHRLQMVFLTSLEAGKADYSLTTERYCFTGSASLMEIHI